MNLLRFDFRELRDLLYLACLIVVEWLNARCALPFIASSASDISKSYFVEIHV